MLKLKKILIKIKIMGNISNEKMPNNQDSKNHENLILEKLANARNILEKWEAHLWKDSQIFKNILKEYNDVHTAFENAKISNKKITQNEFDNLLKEIKDFNLATINARKIDEQRILAKKKPRSEAKYDDLLSQLSWKVESLANNALDGAENLVDDIEDVTDDVTRNFMNAWKTISKSLKNFWKNISDAFEKKEKKTVWKKDKLKDWNDVNWRRNILPKAKWKLKNIEKEISNTDKKSKKYQMLLKEKRKLENIITKANSIIKEHNASKKLNEALWKKDDSIIYKIDKESENISKQTLTENKNRAKEPSDKSDKQEKANKPWNNRSEKKEKSKWNDENISYKAIKDDSGKVMQYNWKIWEKRISISISELKWDEIQELEELKVSNHKEYKNRVRKLIAFKSFLEDAWLDFMWEYRANLKQKLSQSDNFFDYKDWLSTKEELEILNFVSHKIWLNKKESLIDFKNEFEDIKNKRLFNWKNYSSYDNDKVFMQIFKDKWLFTEWTNNIKESVWI